MMKIVISQLAILMLLLTTSCNSKKNNTEASSDENLEIQMSESSKDALDWDGTYEGVLPCADCEGIETSITLNKDLTYTIKDNYLGKKDGVFESKGTFKWSDDGQKITLSEADRHPFFVGENALTQLDDSGNIIEGDLASLYILNKIEKQEIAFTDTKWKLVKLMGKDIKDSKAFISFATEDNRFFGNNSCNNFNGTFEVKNETQLKLSEAATTRMACPDMTMETQFMEVLNTADNFSLHGKTMTLNKAKMAPLAVFEAEE